MAIRITALGTLRVEQDGRFLTRLPAQRVRCALLLVLAVERETTRDAVMGLLWPERPPDRARHLLNQTLYELRQDLGDEWVDSVGDRLVATDQVRIDTAEFIHAVEAGDYDSALRLRAGTFLEGASLSVSRSMEGWIDRQESQLNRLHRRARRGAIDSRVERGDLTGALEIARDWVDRDPLDDEAQHRLIELLAATGDRSGALGQYERYAALVASELDLEPLDDTRELVERIRDGDVGPRPATPVEAVPRPERPVEAAPRQEGEARETPPPPGDTGAPGALAPANDAAAGSGRTSRGASRLRGQAAVAAAIAAVLVVTTIVLTREPSRTEAERTALSGLENALAPQRIAVLYFDDYSPGKDLGHLAAGFTEMLIDQLSQVEALDVISRTAVAHYGDMGGNVLDSIRIHLAPGTIVEGSVMPLGDSIRVTVQLVDGVTAGHLMSERLTAPLDSAALLLDPLAEKAARMLRRRLGTEIELRETREDANEQEAWDLVQRGRKRMADAQIVRENDEAESLRMLDRADSLFARAQALDPGWPEPLLWRARLEFRRAYIVSAVPSQVDPGTAAGALGFLNQLLARWPGHAEALARRGIVRFQMAEAGAAEPDRLYEAANADLIAAIDADGDLAMAWWGDLAIAWWGLSRILFRRGEYAEAERAAMEAVRSDPFLREPNENLWHLFLVSLNLEDFEQAGAWCDELDEHPGRAYKPYCDILLLVTSPRREPDVDRAWELSKQIVGVSPRADTARFRGITELYVARVLLRTGMRDSAVAVARRVVPEETPPAWAAYDIAHFRLLLGDEEGALAALQVHIDSLPGRAQTLDDDWWFRRLWGDPRFEEMLGIGPG